MARNQTVKNGKREGLRCLEGFDAALDARLAGFLGRPPPPDRDGERPLDVPFFFAGGDLEAI